MSTATATNPSSPSLRRSSTTPTKYQRHSATNDELEEDPEENLFVHLNAKVYSFPAPDALTRGSKDGSAQNLSWTARNERLEAVGQLRLYRHHGGASFLQSGKFMLTLLPKSQCWCVDGISKFAIHTKMMIYRIELPYATEEEKNKVEELKKVLTEIVMYEKTRCPFKRGFEEDLPEMDSVSPRQRKLLGRTKRVLSSPGRSIPQRTLSSTDVEQTNEGLAGSSDEVEDEEEQQEEETVDGIVGLIKPTIANVTERPENEHIVDGNDIESTIHSNEEDLARISEPPAIVQDGSQNSDIEPKAISIDKEERYSSVTSQPVTSAPEVLYRVTEQEEESGSSDDQADIQPEDIDGQETSLHARNLSTASTLTPAEPPTTTADAVSNLSFQEVPTLEIPKSALSEPQVADTQISSVEKGSVSPPSAPLLSEPSSPLLSESYPSRPQSPTTTSSFRRSSIRPPPTGLLSRIFAILTGPSSDFFSIVKELASRVVTGVLSNATSGGYMFELVTRDRLPGKWIDSSEDLAQARYSEDLGHASEDEDAGTLRQVADDDGGIDEWMDEEEDDYGVKLGNGNSQVTKRTKWERDLRELD